MPISITMTAISSAAAAIMTPLNFAFYGWLNPETRELLREISIDPLNLLLLIALVLALPLFLGMWVGGRYPAFTARSEKYFRNGALLVFLLFIGLALKKNFALFLEVAPQIIGLVILHNSVALLSGYGIARLLKLSGPEVRAVTLEIGIQNSGLGLLILFTFYPQAGGMILIAAMWGIWHLVSGLTLSQFWGWKYRHAPDA